VAAVAVMAAALGSAAEVSAAAHVPREIAGRLGDPGGGLAATALRLEGVAPSVAHRRALLERLLRPSGRLAVIDAAGSRSLWQTIRDAAPFAAADPLNARPLWRISTVPSHASAVVAAVAAEAEVEVLYDWAGGLVWMSPAPCDDAAAPLIRRAVAEHGGHATLIRAPLPVRAAVAVFSPQDEGLAALSRRVKASFDPKGVLGPGRLQAGL
jgi:glycolate oxidase FAD binding subunit